MAPYSFNMIARVLMTEAQVICVRSKENISVFRFLWPQHEHKSKTTVNFLAFPSVNFFKIWHTVVVTTYISYKISYFC